MSQLFFIVFYCIAVVFQKSHIIFVQALRWTRHGLLRTGHKYSKLGNPLPHPVRVLCRSHNFTYRNSICALLSVWPDVRSCYIGGMKHRSCKASFVGSLDRASVCVCVGNMIFGVEQWKWPFCWIKIFLRTPLTRGVFTSYLLCCTDAPLELTWPGRVLCNKHMSYPDASLCCGCGSCHPGCAAWCARTTNTLTPEADKPSWQKTAIPARVPSVCRVGWRLPFSVAPSGKCVA